MHKRNESTKRKKEEKIIRKIQKLEKMIKNKKYCELRREMHMIEKNKTKIIKEAKERIEYLNYVMRQIRKEREVWIDNKKRLEWNKIMKVCGIRKMNKETTEEYPAKEDIMNFWKTIYEKEEKPDETEELIQEIMNNK